MSRIIKRHYVTIGNRRVHFRSVGVGPVVLLLHKSPQSSAAMMPLAEKLMFRYCVIAPDSPGFGLSDPLPMKAPTIEAIADALDEFTDAVQLPPATVIGVHTGAEIALEFGLRYPERVNFLILDGLALFTEVESEDILQHYLPPFTPRWDGSHLTWLWARLREQVIFFPWYKKDPAARMSYNVPDADYLHSWFMDFMYAGEHYRGGYGAAFRYRNSASIKDIVPPTAALYRTGDVLQAHQQRLPPLPGHAWTEIIPSGHDELDNRIIELLDERVLGKQAARRYQHAPADTTRKQEPNYVDIGDRQVAVVTAGDPSQPLLMVLHDLAGSADSSSELIAAAAKDHYVICPDLPGHGENAAITQSRFSIDKTVDVLCGLLEWAGVDHCRLLSLGAGCVFIPALIKDNPEISISAGMHNPLLLDPEARAALKDNFASAIVPDNYGTFITKLWYALRDGRLFWPWYEPFAANIRRHTPSLRAKDVHQSLFDALRCGNNYHLIWQAFFETDVIDQVKSLPAPLTITISKTHPCHESVLALTAQLPAADCRETSDDWSEVIGVHL